MRSHTGTPATTTPVPNLLADAARVVSVDALRGFDMFWIVGADALVASLRPLQGVNRWPVVVTLTEQLEHVTWEGFHFYDLIFPLFVFLMGVSTVFSLDRVRATDGVSAAYGRVVRRGIVLILLGIFYYGAVNRTGEPEQYRLVGVLQRIGICYVCGGLLFLACRLRGLVVATLVLLLGYWALLAFVPVPGVGAGNYAEGKNLTNYIDSRFLPGYRWDGDWDPEGLLSHLPAVASGLFGMFAGMILLGRPAKPLHKCGLLVVLGIACLALGGLWGGLLPGIKLTEPWHFPVIKKLWTSSYVLVAAGYSYLLLATFYLVIDIFHWHRWALPFIWIGMNPIAIYLLDNLVGGYPSLVRRVVHAPVLARLAPYDALLLSLLGLGLAIGVAWWLQKRRIFIRV